MANRKENLKSLFTNTRSRLIIVITGISLLLAVIIGVVKFRSSGEILNKARLGGVPSIKSIPGALEQTAQYAKLQEEQNVTQAQQALQKGNSSIPTIIRAQSLGAGAQTIGPPGGVGFSTLAREDEISAQRGMWLKSLQDSNCSKEAVASVLSQGAKFADLKGGCTCAQLRDNGYQIKDLVNICSCAELKKAGFNASQFKEAGFSAGSLRACGFNACELKNAGFSAQEMKDGGFSDGELKGAGFSDNEIAKASGLPAGITAADVRSAGCQVEALKRLRASGVTAAAIRRISGCSAAQLKAAGFSAQDLKNAGFSAAELKQAGFSPAELRAAGFSARDLLNAGFTPDDLKAAGFTPGEIDTAESELPPGISPLDVKKAGCSSEAIKKERLAGVSAKLIRQYAGCSLQALRAGGFSDDDLARAGFTPQQLATAIIPEPTGPVSDAEIRAAGCDAAKLRALFNQGVTAKRIHALNGCSAADLKNAGFDAQALADAGFTPEQLLAAGFTPEQLRRAGISTAAVVAAGRVANCSLASLQAAKAAGVSAKTIKETLGCSAAAMKAAGFSAKELKDAGYTAGELRNAGFSAMDLKNAGFSAQELKAAGFSARDLKNAGFSAQDLKDAGFTAKDLKDAGFSAKDLKDAGFSADDLKAAGFSDTDIRNAGFPSSQLTALAPVAPAAPATSSIPGTAIPSIGGAAQQTANDMRTQQLQAILAKQKQQASDQRYQQKIQQRLSQMLGTSNQSLQAWQKVSIQSYVASSAGASTRKTMVVKAQSAGQTIIAETNGLNANKKAVIKTGDILFAVIDTAVNSDEPSPILATIVSDKFKGAKLIGNFNLPSNPNSEKMVINFNTMSVPGVPQTISISAYAIDPDTGRTALASKVNHHYLLRYGSLFASSFIEGFGNAFQSANTTVTVGGTGGGNNVTVQNGIGRSALENAIIGLATVGKNWGQFAQQQFNMPKTMEIYAGTGIGVLFIRDVSF